MKTPRGKCPSLVSGTLGRPKFEVAKRKRTCYRCEKEIIGGSNCVSIPLAGRMGSRTYCCECLHCIIAQSQKDLDEIEAKLSCVN